MTAKAGYLTIPQTDGEQDVMLENGNAWRLLRRSLYPLRYRSEWKLNRRNALKKGLTSASE